MSEHPKFDLLEFFERWTKFAGLLAGIVSAIAYAAQSFWLSIAMIWVGWVLMSSWLIGIVLQRVRKDEVLLAAGVKSRRGYRYPSWKRVVAILAMIILTQATGIWSCVGIYSQLRNSIPPYDAVQLPSAEATGVSMQVQPGPMWMWVGLINDKVNSTAITQAFNSKRILFPGKVSPRFAELGRVSTIWVTVTGKSIGGPIQVTNKVPIKVVSYKPISDVVHLAGMAIGGGGQDVWLLGADISATVGSTSDQIIWADYTSDLRERLIEAQKGRSLDQFPTEIRKAISSGAKQLPDYFLLGNNDKMVLSVATFFKTPGIYRLQFGVEYIFKDYRAIVWTNPPIEVYVLGSYYLWVGSNNLYSLDSICSPHPEDAKYGHQCIIVKREGGLTYLIGDVALSTDKKLLAMGRSDGALSLWDTATGRELRILKGQHIGQVTDVAFTPDGTILASASEVVELWDLARGTVVKTLADHVSRINSIAFSPDGKVLATASECVKLWDSANGWELRSLKGDTGWVLDVKFSPNGQVVASGNSNGSIVLWDAANGIMLHRFSIGKNAVQSVAFSPDGKKLASGGDDGIIRVWDITTEKEIWNTALKGDFVGTAVVRSVAFSPSENSLAAAIPGKTVLLDAISGAEIRVIDSGLLAVGSRAIAFSQDGTQLASSYMQQIRLWDSTAWTNILTIDVK